MPADALGAGRGEDRDSPRWKIEGEHTYTPEEIARLNRGGPVLIPIIVKLYAGKGAPPRRFTGMAKVTAETLMRGGEHEISILMADEETWKTAPLPTQKIDATLPLPAWRPHLPRPRSAPARVVPSTRAREPRRRSVARGPRKARAPGSRTGDDDPHEHVAPLAGGPGER
jgi:hypothetical protein